MDPFSTLTTALWTAVDASPLAALIAPGNRAKYNTVEGMKVHVSNADLSELALLPIAGAGNLHASSCTSMIIRQFAFYISTGTQNVYTDLFPIEWELFRFLVNWQTTISSTLWEGETFIKRLDLLTVADALSDAEKNRGIKGWSAAWAFEVEMHFGHQTILES